MKQDQFPKVLIVGESFHLKSGGGITLGNLFKGWPVNRIAVVTSIIDLSGMDHCMIYYKLGYEETKRPWPFHLIQPKHKSGPVYLNKDKTSVVQDINTQEKISRIKNFILNVRHYTGLYPFIYRLRISEKFIEWVEEFQPDIIYTQLSDLRLMQFITQIIMVRKYPLAIHIMDDWPKTLKEPGLLYYYWKRVIDKSFRKLLDRSSILMSICHAMSDEYLQRYGKTFIPFHNTIDAKKWNKVPKKDWNSHGVFQILYAGRIGMGTYDSIPLIAKVVEKLGNEGYKVLFKIRAGSVPNEFSFNFNDFQYTKKDNFLPHEEMPIELASVDLLVIPLDFDKDSLKFTKLSMPTKVSEYLASGTPILVIASQTTALYKYANELKWGYTVSENSIEKIADAIRHLYEDINLREHFGTIGKKVGLENHDGDKVRNDFRKALVKAAN